MHRIWIPLVALALLAAAPAAAGDLAKARLTDCDKADRTATFEGDARARPEGVRMQVRFVLLRREGRRWKRMRGEGLGTWQTSDRGVARYVYTKTVENLPAPGVYRMRVVFRWRGPDDEVLARRALRTRACRVPDPRPDLTVAAVEARPGGFAVVVRNTGRSDAGPFVVRLGQQVREIAGLRAGTGTEVVFAEGCHGHLSAAVDPDGRVDERDEADNDLVQPCPGL